MQTLSMGYDPSEFFGQQDIDEIENMALNNMVERTDFTENLASPLFDSGRADPLTSEALVSLSTNIVSINNFINNLKSFVK